jgi:phosphatidate cytidylyltransferase
MAMADRSVLLFLGAIWLLLIFASIVVFALTRLRKQKDHTELIERTESWWVIIAIFSIAMVSSQTVALCLLAFISFLALKEFFSMIPTRRVDRRVLFWAYLAIPIQYYWAGTNWYGMFIIFIPIYMFLFISGRLVLTQKPEGFLKSASAIHWGLMTTVFAISHMAYLLVLPSQSNNPSGGPGLLLYLLFLTQLNDVAQYVSGKVFGRTLIIPLISPKKTWEGLAGGVVVTMLMAFLLSPFLTPLDLTAAMVVGLLISGSGFLGDVTISAIKRDLGVKDTGFMIPGHGGIMDRIDSLTFTAPLFFHFVRYFFY